MKILHTSDWHIGKQLHKFDLSEDLDLFFEWLIAYIKNESIDVLLVSGDIFDQANPSQAAYKQYYDVLKQLINLDCKIILTGGNHDSASVLNAPAELLKAFDISVIGGSTDDIADMFIEIERKNEKLVVAAIPFLKHRASRPGPGRRYGNPPPASPTPPRLNRSNRDYNLTFQKSTPIIPIITTTKCLLSWVISMYKAAKFLKVNAIFKLGTKRALKPTCLKEFRIMWP